MSIRDQSQISIVCRISLMHLESSKLVTNNYTLVKGQFLQCKISLPFISVQGFEGMKEK